MNRKFKIGVGIGVAAVILGGGGYWYSNIDKQKPEYAVQLAEQAIANHDRDFFYKVVNVDSVLNDSYNGLIEGLTDTDKTMGADAREAIKNFTQMLRNPLLASLKAAIDSYVETGTFNAQNNAGVNELLARTGIDKVEYRGVESVAIDPDDEDKAVARIKIYQPELANEDFILEVELDRNSDGDWQIVRLRNFQDFVNNINQTRRAQLDRYLEQTAEITARHDTTIREAEQKYASILALGTLGQENIRSDLRTLMLDVIKKDWEVRKQELFSVNVPRGAETLQNLRLKICDLEIGYAEDYAQWMEDKKASTIRAAEEKQRQSKALKAEVTALARRMAS